MRKRNKIIYWIATLWLLLKMRSSGIVQLFKVKEEVDMMTYLGYPLGFLTIAGIMKMLGVVTVLILKAPLLKEWAYTGFFLPCWALSSPTLPERMGPRNFLDQSYC